MSVVADLDHLQLDHLDHDLVHKTERELAGLDELVAQPLDPQVAYCSPEFGITASLPQYAGGLGILAGDHLKAASDLGAPLAGVGLFYRQGVFRQIIEGTQQEEIYRAMDPESIGATDTGVMVEVPFPGRQVFARVWRIDVGRVPLILLDTDVESNLEGDREITDRLYIGFRRHRIEQEMILGVGGARALEALRWPIKIHHLNEGHAGFVVLELIDRVIENGDVAGALERVKPGLIFTTHTPVPAGIDRFDAEVIVPYLECWTGRWDVPLADIWSLGEDPDDPDKFNMAAFCLRTCGGANGVSELHGEVSRQLFAGIGLGDRIEAVTNGVHARTWTAPQFQSIFDHTLGPSWADGDSEAWDLVDGIDDASLDRARGQSSSLLADLVRDRTGVELRPDELIIGFARRFAPYKRATPLLRHPDRLFALLSDEERPVRLVFAGKAHPSDDEGKELISQVVELSGSPQANGRVIFIPDYDMDIAQALVQGCDIWLNHPIRPREASGTSGEKAVLNGGLNCSILDGWWAEMFDGENGWGIPASAESDPDARDEEEAGWILDALNAIADEYYTSRPDFYARIRHAWRTLGPRVTAARMLRDYRDRWYLPALERS